MLKFLSLSAAALLLVAGPALAAPDDLPAPAEKPAPAERGGRAPSGLMRYDTNKDGVVDRAEWKAGQEARFKRLDTNGDGKLTRDEFLQIAEKLKEKLGEEKGDKLKTFLEKAFDKMDTKKAGFLTLEQFKSFNLRELLLKRKQEKK